MGLISRVSSRTYRFLLASCISKKFRKITKMMRRALTSAIASPQRALTTKVTLIPGDGIGPEVMEATKEVIAAVNAPIKFEEKSISEIRGFSDEQKDDLLENINKNKLILQGHILAGKKQKMGEKLSLQMQLQRELDTFARVSHVKSFDGVNTRYKNVDIIIVRENTEGEYCGEEHQSIEGVVESLKLTTKDKCERVAHVAFDYALRHNRKKVTCVHKANIMKKGDGLFRKTCTEVSKLYPTIEFEDMIVDNTCMQLVSNPYQFDVMVTPNLYGNIIENLGAGLIGGAGVHSGATYSSDVAIFGPGARYTFNSGAGKDIANPTAIFMAADNLLAHAGYNKHSESVKSAAGKVRTKDLGGRNSTSEFTAEVIKNIKPVAQRR